MISFLLFMIWMVVLLNLLAWVVTGVVGFLRWVAAVPPIDPHTFSFEEMPTFIDEDFMRKNLKRGLKRTHEDQTKLPEHKEKAP